ncbi:MAG: phosphoenolpyruvate carboxylase [Blastochloris sp.]|nr:phosphoenolpyruvate carboxylase [Blastochloris sp.]
MAQPDFVKTGFAKIDRDLAFMVGCFHDVLVDLGEKEIAQALPFLHSGKAATKPLPHRFSSRLMQAYGVVFQLLNMVEENTAAQMRRARASLPRKQDEPGLWTSYLKQLKKSGLKEKEIAEVLREVRVEPVLTAHPTEAKRSTVLEQHRALYLLLVSRENSMWTPAELDGIREEIKVALERLWRTGEVLHEKPKVAKERQTITYHLREVFPNVLPRLDLRLRQAWQKAGLDPKWLQSPEQLPQLSFGTWVGGDRDGHPLVTDETTVETLNELRLQALFILQRRLSQLPRILSLSEHLHQVPDKFKTEVQSLARDMGERGEACLRRNPREPWRQLANIILAKLPLHSGDLTEVHQARADEWPGCYRFPRELLADLRLLRDSLVKIGASRIAHSDIDPIIRQVQTFGFHLARLDIRQNSQFHDKAMSQLMTAAGLDGDDFGNWTEKDRLNFLTRELRSPRPFLHADSEVGPQADAVLRCYRALAAHIKRHGGSGLGSLIVSMTKRVSDLLVVYVLAREAGLATYTTKGLTCSLPVVPLFETLDDLQNSSGILRAFLEHPITRATLKHQNKVRQEELDEHHALNSRPVQQVMIGYSDSNKDAGILASQWGLHQTQKELQQAGEDHEVKIRFFHGRGGTISRGAGPTDRFLGALPNGALGGDLRVTEQGETISQKYANQITAVYNLELLLAGTTGVTLQHQYRPRDYSRYEPLAAELCQFSSEFYRAFILAEDFINFYGQATPIDALEQSRIGSRPSRRTGVRSLEDLRAIPWVFSWNQSRFYVPGWFGVGSALEKLAQQGDSAFETLQEAVKVWPYLRYVLTNVETNLASADLSIMEDYASLVEDTKLRERFFSLIASEYRRTRRMLDRLFGGQSLEKRRPRMVATLKLREEALATLHVQQISLLREWRKLRVREDHSAANELLPDLLLSVNAIAGGLRTTG